MSDRSVQTGKRSEAASSSASPPTGKRLGRPPRSTIEPRQLLMVAHLLSGRTQREAAELVGVDEKTVSRWLQEPLVRQEFATQLAAISTELWGRVAAEVADAWEVFRGLLRSEDERIRLRACTFFLDRVLAVLPIERLLEEGRLAATPMPSDVAKFFEERGEAGGDAA